MFSQNRLHKIRELVVARKLYEAGFSRNEIASMLKDGGLWYGITLSREKQQ